MARRFLTFFFAFSVFGGPFASQICEAVCATHIVTGGSNARLHQHDSADAIAWHDHHRGSSAPRVPDLDHAGFRTSIHVCEDLAAIVSESRIPAPTLAAPLAPTRTAVGPLFRVFT